MLAIEDVSVKFGGVRAVNNLSIEVQQGEIVGLIGPNGAGKTTTIDAICGFVTAVGSVHVKGQDVTRLRPHMRARNGISRTFQSLELFEDMTLAENLGVAAESLGTREKGGTRLLAIDALQRVGLDVDPDLMPGALSHGDRKLLAVARALISRPALLLLDEPAAGLNSAESGVLGQRLRQLRDGGASILLVDHDMGLVSSTCDRLYVLDFGELIAHGKPQEIMRNPRVISAYLGAGTAEKAAL
ncbi:MAG TPA: ABC transporter ATP-binding protein [Jatrophihabitans sp.]